jgi:hypothetical protein
VRATTAFGKYWRRYDDLAVLADQCLLQQMYPAKQVFAASGVLHPIEVNV